jgi:hypothetical protein
MTIEIKSVDRGLGPDDAPLVQIDVRYTGDADAELHDDAEIDPLLVVAMARDPATVDATLQQIADRSRSGESTPVLVSHVDALGLRDRLLQLALDRVPS